MMGGKMRFLLLFIGLALLSLVVYQTGPQKIFGGIKRLGLKLSIILLPYLCVYILDAIGWRITLQSYGEKIKFFHLFSARMAGETINIITPTAYLGGEPVKAYILQAYHVPLIDGLASVVTAKSLMLISHILFILLGLGAATLRLHERGTILSPALSIVFLMVVAMGLFMATQRRGVFSSLLTFCEKIGVEIPFLKKNETSLKSLDKAISDFYGTDKRGVWLSLLFFSLGWMVGIFEVFLLFFFLGIPLDLTTALAIESLAGVIKGGASFIPGSIGAQEGGNILLFLAFGFSEVDGMTFSVVRRIRELLWITFGLVSLTRYGMKLIPWGSKEKG